MFKYLISFLSVLFMFIGITTPSIAKMENCTKEEALGILVKFIPDIKIIEVRRAPIESLCEVAFEVKGNKSIIYLNPSKKKIFNGSIVDAETKANLTKQRLMEINRVDVSKIPLDDALLLGNHDAKYKVIVFDDPE